MNRQRVLDAHTHQWDVRATPREASAFVKLLGWNRPLMHWLALRVFPGDAAEFFGNPDFILDDYLPGDHRANTGDWAFDGFVHVEASWKAKGPLGSVAETAWLAELGPDVQVIVGYADLGLGSQVDAVLEAHLAASDRFRGVRYPLANHPAKGVWSACEEPSLPRDPKWREGYARLSKYGLSFDATVYHHQLDELAELAHEFPDIPMILCHAGTPVACGGPFGGLGATDDERRKTADDWAASMARLAELPNVQVKISGLAMPVLGWGYHQLDEPVGVERLVDDFRPIVDHVIEQFGTQRCMFGSNFPIDGVSASWTTIYEAFSEIIANRSAQERDALFAGNAARAYRINLMGAKP